ncbi:MAG TPA: ABC transporter ATP-binding protein [Ktedonobacteraceae bacterium]|jgi:branched-chain amino acid transport system ATP-binding protein
MPLLTLNNIYAGYDGGDVLKGISLTLEAGTTTCIVGPNGAGKSTLLRVLSGLLKPRQGEILFAGQTLSGLHPRQILGRGIVQVPQQHSLFPALTVRENVRLGAYTLRDKALIARRLAGVEEMFPVVRQRAHEKAGNLSGGQQRQVEFARALMLDPRLLLLDEPSMGLDPRTFRQVIETIQAMQHSGLSIILVEQNARTGLQISQRGVVLESGRVRLEGAHNEILDNPEIAHLYLGGTLSNA